jgi:uncharacterized membrane protein YhhN
MLNALIIAAAAVLMVGLLYAEKKGSLHGKLLTKPFLSALFICAAVFQPHPAARYYGLLLAGLTLCLGGDLFLALPGQKMFRVGLISFLLGHILYIFAFSRLADMNSWTATAAVGTLMAGIFIYRRLRRGLGDMRVPVIFYIIVISLMLCSAASVAGDAVLAAQGRAAVAAGALLFYISDLFVARQRFVRAGFVNRLIGLPLYYTGQFLLAFSVGMF